MVVVEFYRVRDPKCGLKVEGVPQLPNKAPFNKDSKQWEWRANRLPQGAWLASQASTAAHGCRRDLRGKDVEVPDGQHWSRGGLHARKDSSGRVGWSTAKTVDTHPRSSRPEIPVVSIPISVCVIFRFPCALRNNVSRA